MKTKQLMLSYDQAVDSLDLPDLPRGWTWAKLSDLAADEPNSITDGPFGSNLKTEHYTDSGPRVIRLQNIGDSIFHDARAHISEAHYSSLQKHAVVEDDLVIAALGESLPRACVIPKWVGPAIVKADCIRFRPDRRLAVSQYLNYALNFSDTRRRTSSIIHGVGRPRLNLGEIKSIFIPLAPLNEQRRIADALDELLSDLDAGISALQRVRAKLALYRAAVLRAAVVGDLTAEWREKNPATQSASELLEHVLVERRRRWEKEQTLRFKDTAKEPPKNWKAKYKEPVAPDTSKLPYLPGGWCWATVDQIIREPLRNGHSAKVTQERDGVPTFSLSAVTYGDFSDRNIKHTSADPHRVEDLWVEPDDIFVQRSNTPELVGTTRRYTGDSHRAIFPDLLIRLRVTPPLLPAYITACLQSSDCHNYFRRSAQGISGSMPKIDQEVVERATLPIPPVLEQEALVEALEDQISVIEHLEADIAAKLKASDALRQSILRGAFSGQLVTQDPNDESASALLARVACEREEQNRSTQEAKRANKNSATRRRPVARGKTGELS